MDFDPDDPATWPADAESWYKVSYTTVTISTRQVPFPPDEYYAIFGSVFNRDPRNLSLYNADSADVSDLLASLPQWELTGEAEANPARTWRVIWPYHPVITTFSTGGKINNHSDNFAVLEDLSEHIQEEIPEKLDTNRDLVIFHKTLPLAIFHSNQTVRWKFANHIDRLFQERPLPPKISPSGTTKQVFLRYLKPLPDVLPLPWNLPTRWLRASPHPSVTPPLKRNAATGFHTLSTLNVSLRPPI